ncbi:hypothetical protein [Meiothermus hypogaeus]|uniref:Uncharacterized protein n=3 Tax=Meiothermus hypogaeus TaxID=884155 RepID=A0A511R0E0_9DEIN|nr:hypothetical protein [Meiothermus hypogaeus]RIH77573.1 hypothetical protein Mhypo_01955 [Meiothermus hypogaeus]GEM83089.1 hypothetical protein MHY01S_12550 [Meiothermus hypogaeus NBRC 106114]
MQEASAQFNPVMANQLLESLIRQLDQAIIFDKTIRARLEDELEALRGILQSPTASPSWAKERLEVFRNFYQESFSNGQIV